MIVIIMEKVSASVRGELTRWLLEPQTGIFIGNVSALVRDKLWDLVCEKLRGGGAMMFFNAQTEQGYSIRTYGSTTRQVEDFDGLLLIRTPARTPEPEPSH